MITREQVADLRVGDVVRVTGWYGVNVEGPVSEGPKTLWLGQHLLVRDCDGSVGKWAKSDATLTVVSRAPRQLYVNHDRSEPAPGDVVRDADRADSVASWSRAVGSIGNHGWRYTGSANHWCVSMPARLRLLVDGETGQAVQ